MLRNRFKRWLKVGAATGLILWIGLMGLVWFSPSVVAKPKAPQDKPLITIAVAELPLQGRDMMALIYKGGPFRYDKDGTVFGNRERILPAKNRGYYREYTVKTPSERTRGARRIICAGLMPAAPEACYYTDDHYASFRKIVE